LKRGYNSVKGRIMSFITEKIAEREHITFREIIDLRLMLIKKIIKNLGEIINLSVVGILSLGFNII